MRTFIGAPGSLLEATISFCGENAARYFENGKVPSRATRTKTALVFAFTDRDHKPFVVHLSSPPKFFAGLAIFISCLGLLLSKDFVTLIIISLLIAIPAAYYFMYHWLQHY